MMIHSSGHNAPPRAPCFEVESWWRDVTFAALLAIFTVAAVACVALMLRPGWYVNTGNLHDAFIPLNSALAAQQGLRLHEGFHTPFGWVYSLLNRFAWLYVRGVGDLSINDMVVVTSIFWASLILAVFLLYILSFPEEYRPKWSHAWLLGLFLALLSLNFRGVSTFNVRDVTWYGVYNGHLWALISLQMISVFMAAGAKTTLRIALITALVQALCVTISVNYKISFGFGSIFLAAAPLFSRSSGSGWRAVYLLVVFLFCILVSISLSPEGYSYGLYLGDIRGALAAKSEFSSDNNYIVAVLVTLFLCVALVALLRLCNAGKGGADGVVQNKYGVAVVDVVFSFLVSAGVVVSVLGDFSKPFYMIFACVGVCVLLMFLGRRGWLLRGAVSIICVIVIFGLWSNLRIAYYKDGSLKGNHERVVVSTGYGDLRWIIPGGAAYGRLIELFGLVGNPKKLEVIANIAFPLAVEHRNYRVPFSNLDYVRSLNLARRTIENLMSPEHKSVLMLAFSNPLPILVGGSLPNGSQHWIHFGTSTPMFARDNELFAAFQRSDIIVMPVLSVDSRSQVFLNCKFFDWNMGRGEPYKLVHYDEYNIYYMKSGRGGIVPLNRLEIGSRCARLLNEIRVGKM